MHSFSRNILITCYSKNMFLVQYNYFAMLVQVNTSTELACKELFFIVIVASIKQFQFVNKF